MLEPMCRVDIDAPNAATSKASSAVSSRRGQILGICSHPEWPRWDRVEAIIPEAGLQGLDAKLHSMSHGLAGYAARYDHVSEISGRIAEDAVKHQAALSA